jgi:hypothetical protein
MKNIYFIHVIFLSLILSGCTSSDDEALVNDGERKLRHLTITQVENDATTRSLFDLTRASLTENEADNTLSASWTARDELSLCILTDLGSPISSIGTLTTLSPGETSAFSTDIVCGNGDYIAVVYPNNNVNITPTSNDVTFILNLSGQDGTLGTLATNYHFIYGLSKITSVTDNTASATIKMNSLLTICKFSFVDESDNPIFIKDLFICYGTSFGDFPKNTYPTSASITLSANSQSNTVNANGILDQNDNILTIRSNGLNEIYVALLPTGERDFIFKVINDNGTYEGRATAILNAGEFVPAPNLKLTKQTNNY